MCALRRKVPVVALSSQTVTVFARQGLRQRQELRHCFYLVATAAVLYLSKIYFAMGVQQSPVGEEHAVL